MNTWGITVSKVVASIMSIMLVSFDCREARVPSHGSRLWGPRFRGTVHNMSRNRFTGGTLMPFLHFVIELVRHAQSISVEF